MSDHIEKYSPTYVEVYVRSAVQGFDVCGGPRVFPGGDSRRRCCLVYGVAAVPGPYACPAP